MYTFIIVRRHYHCTRCIQFTITRYRQAPRKNADGPPCIPHETILRRRSVYIFCSTRVCTIIL